MVEEQHMSEAYYMKKTTFSKIIDIEYTPLIFCAVHGENLQIVYSSRVIYVYYPNRPVANSE